MDGCCLRYNYMWIKYVWGSLGYGSVDGLLGSVAMDGRSWVAIYGLRCKRGTPTKMVDKFDSHVTPHGWSMPHSGRRWVFVFCPIFDFGLFIVQGFLMKHYQMTSTKQAKWMPISSRMFLWAPWRQKKQEELRGLQCSSQGMIRSLWYGEIQRYPV